MYANIYTYLLGNAGWLGSKLNPFDVSRKLGLSRIKTSETSKSKFIDNLSTLPFISTFSHSAQSESGRISALLRVGFRVQDEEEDGDESESWEGDAGPLHLQDHLPQAHLLVGRHLL